MADREKLINKRINLVQGDKKFTLTPIEAVFFIALFVLIVVFAKFAVYDPVSSAAAARNEVSKAKSELESLVASNAGNKQLGDEYAKYVIEGQTELELSIVDRREVLDVVKSNIIGTGALSTLSIKGNLVTISCYGIDLQTASALVERLESDKRVTSVMVGNAEIKGATTSTLTIMITVADPAKDEKGANNG